MDMKVKESFTVVTFTNNISSSNSNGEVEENATNSRVSQCTDSCFENFQSNGFRVVLMSLSAVVAGGLLISPLSEQKGDLTQSNAFIGAICLSIISVVCGVLSCSYKTEKMNDLESLPE
jgi:hypothetical protein